MSSDAIQITGLDRKWPSIPFHMHVQCLECELFPGLLATSLPWLGSTTGPLAVQLLGTKMVCGITSSWPATTPRPTGLAKPSMQVAQPHLAALPAGMSTMRVSARWQKSIMSKAASWATLIKK